MLERLLDDVRHGSRILIRAPGLSATAGLLIALVVGGTPTDPPTYLGVFVLLACVSLSASYLPARRASRLDPVRALRQD